MEEFVPQYIVHPSIEFVEAGVRPTVNYIHFCKLQLVLKCIIASAL